MVVPVDGRVAASACDQPAVEWKSRDPGDAESDHQAAQNNGEAGPAVIAPEITSMIELSTISITVMDVGSKVGMTI